jgi:hypothetical protein
MPLIQIVIIIIALHKQQRHKPDDSKIIRKMCINIIASVFFGTNAHNIYVDELSFYVSVNKRAFKV